MNATSPLKIQDYAIVGDCRSAALVGSNGSIDWLCWPRFDSAAIFAAILDAERGGRWQIAPSHEHRAKRRYAEATNVLETRFECASGSALLTDLMPVASEERKKHLHLPENEILRQIECTAGVIEIEMRFEPRANFGRDAVRIEDRSKLGARIDVGRGAYWFRSTHPVQIKDDCILARLRLHAGEIAQYSLTYAEVAPAVLCSLEDAAQERIEISKDWWAHWAQRIAYDGPYRDAVIRSALVLKQLAYAPSGAIIAAPTTSLPERLGGDLNWDYRYCWLRDASMTIRALIGLGFWDEAESFMEWMLHATRQTQPEFRILYTVFGENAPRERELEGLHGYCNSRPVRIGNGARSQLQLDVYGEVIDAAAQFVFHGREFDPTTQRVLIDAGRYVAQRWQSPDEGIWEPRTGREHHTHSRLLCWTAMDRLCTMAHRKSIEGAPVDLFMRERDAIAQDIHRNAWNERLQSYTSVLGGNDLDASLLQLAWYGFEPADSPRMLSTYLAVDRQLRAGPGLLYRYKTEPPEGAFGICSFWESEYLALGGGTLKQATQTFEQFLSYGNDLGLYAEEVDPRNGDALGNFPQAFTHVGLISAALSLLEREGQVLQLQHRPVAQHPYLIGSDK